MSFATKRILACVLLVAVCIWPLAHYGLVQALDLNPWKWFGWAMYTVPPMRVRARAISVEEGRQLDLTDLPRDVAGRVLLAYDRFSGHRMEFGGRTPPDDFARALFRAYPAVRTLRIDVQDVRVDRGTAMVVERALTPYTYTRPDLE